MNNENETLCEEVSFNKAYLINVQAAEFAYYKCGDRDAALDLVQDALQKFGSIVLKLNLAR
jgi:RNA polymerase sigma-70 factor (ECF subfamily)